MSQDDRPDDNADRRSTSVYLEQDATPAKRPTNTPTLPDHPPPQNSRLLKLLDDVLGRCDNVACIAVGGQKRVLSADHPDFGAVVIKYGEYGVATRLDRITREVQLLRDIDSRYYPTQHDFLIDPVHREFLVIEERLDAVDLTAASVRFNTDEQILTLLRHLVCGLSVVWERNVVHRDIKPANILITSTNEPRIIDLGIARFLDEASLTHPLALQGPATPIYAAPEQLQNRKVMINHRTDFFLLGVLILELMLGFHPFDPRRVGNSNTLVENLLAGVYVKPEASREPHLVHFVDNVLDVKPYRRFRTVAALMAHLRLDSRTC